MLEGGQPDPDNPPPTELRDWQLAKRFGWTYEQIRDAPAVWLDWMLRIDGIASDLSQRKA